jgi:hypothetical protein
MARFESDIREIRQDADVIPLPLGERPTASLMPYAASAMTCRLLAKMALDHARAAEHALGRSAGEDALLLIETLAEGGQGDRGAAAHASMATGEAFTLLHEIHRARDCFEIAVRLFDGARDIAHAARARVALADALLALHDASARAVLEDAGELYEDIGDESSARAIDMALRQAQAELEESPRSFHVRAAASRLAR